MSMNFHYLLKYVVIGDSGVGKSNILLRYIYNSFSEEFKTTVGVEFGAKNIELDKKIYRIQIWDTAGQENFRSIARAYYKNSVCACVVYDISSRSSFENIQSWIDDCTKQTAKSVLLLLIGNKSDLKDQREVSYEEGEAYAKSHNMLFLETSAKTGQREVSYEEGEAYAKEHNMLFLETSAKTGNNIGDIFEKSLNQIAKNIKNNVYNLENDSCGIRVGITYII